MIEPSVALSHWRFTCKAFDIEIEAEVIIQFSRCLRDIGVRSRRRDGIADIEP